MSSFLSLYLLCLLVFLYVSHFSLFSLLPFIYSSCACVSVLSSRPISLFPLLYLSLTNINVSSHPVWRAAEPGGSRESWKILLCWYSKSNFQPFFLDTPQDGCPDFYRLKSSTLSPTSTGQVENHVLDTRTSNTPHYSS